MLLPFSARIQPGWPLLCRVLLGACLHHIYSDLYFSRTAQAAMQACTHCAPVKAGTSPHLPCADCPGDLELSRLTLGLTTTSSSLLTGSTTRTEASLSPFATIPLLPGKQASSSLSDSEKIL